LLLWFPLTPVALLASPSAPTTGVSPEIATEEPKSPPAAVLEALI
jgi:hypothetical protein